MHHDNRPQTIEVTLTLQPEGGSKGESQQWSDNVLWHEFVYSILYDHNIIHDSRPRKDATVDLWPLPANRFKSLIRGSEVRQFANWKVIEVTPTLEGCFVGAWGATRLMGYWDFFYGLGGYRHLSIPDGVTIDENGEIAISIGGLNRRYTMKDECWPWPLINAANPEFRTLCEILRRHNENSLTALANAQDPLVHVHGRRVLRSLQELQESMLTRIGSER